MTYKNKEDQAKAARRHYDANKDKMVARAQAHTKVVKEQVKYILFLLKRENGPCPVCGGNFPLVCYDFDHRDRRSKCFNVAETRYWTSIQRVFDEVVKCNILCANCHRTKTSKERKAEDEFYSIIDEGPYF